MPSADSGPVVLWRLGEALLAVALDDVEEVSPVDRDGHARARSGTFDVVVPPGLGGGDQPVHAVILRRQGRPDLERMALAADGVEGVVERVAADEMVPPAWLAGLEAPHLAALIRVDDARVAALLDAAALFRNP